MTIQTNSNQGPHSPPSSKRKEIRRCVSMCTSEMTSPDSSNYAQDIQSTSHDDNHNQSPDHDIQSSSLNETSRKRARNENDSQSNEQTQKDQPINSNASSRDSQDLDPSCRLNPNEETSASNETKKKLNLKINVNACAHIQKTPRNNLNIYSHGGHDPNIAYIPPCTPIPSSPVRSVISCDLDAGDASMSCIDIGVEVQVSQTFRHGLEPQSLQEVEMRSQVQDTGSNLEVVAGSSAINPCVEHKEEPAHQQSSTQCQSQDQELDRERKEITTAIAHLSPDLQIHLRALRIETSLAPIKPLLHRLLTHQGHNRRGTFNVPVDHIRFSLKDYLIVVKEPMDLGTIKTNLYANVYHSHAEVARDIRLVFRNACLYNPPLHPVHEAAKHLLDYFEEGYAIILSKKAPIINGSTCTPLIQGGAAVGTGPVGVSSASGASTSASASVPQFQPQLYSLPPPRHQCTACLGRACGLCNAGCLSLEPALLICAGSSCSGSKIRRNITYYCTRDGTKTWCQKCFPNLPAILPNDEAELNTEGNLYKRDLLKRRNDEDVVERWIDCSLKCGNSVHEVCAFANEFSTEREHYICPLCANSTVPVVDNESEKASKMEEGQEKSYSFSFLTGTTLPEQIRDIPRGQSVDSRALPSCSISDFIQKKLKERMRSLDCPEGAEETLTVRVISDCEKEFNVPDAVLRHFRMQQNIDTDGIHTFQEPPSCVGYRSRAIALFQRIDGTDVCIFCMYVQEYDGADADDQSGIVQKKRVYLAYIDSVEHFRPRRLRTQVYHEMLSAYFATARERGFSKIHIWSCPPSRGNSFVFWGHPQSQRTPTKERLLGWYHDVLCYAVNRGIITDVKSLYEDSFEKFDKASKEKISNDESTLPCPPLLEGDFWVEEAIRVQSANITRVTRSKKITNDMRPLDCEGDFAPSKAFGSNQNTRCPSIQLSILLENCIMSHPNSTPFLRPVNAVALKLKDYHVIVKKPMDLSTVLTQIILGEYAEFHEAVSDLELVFHNAMSYNPKGHPIHALASDLMDYVQRQLTILANYWNSCGLQTSFSRDGEEITYASFSNLSMRLSSLMQEQPTESSADDVAGKESSKEELYTPEKRAGLLFDGPEGIAKLMVGEDTFLLDKKYAYKDTTKNKKKKSGKKNQTTSEPPNSDGIRRGSWLSDEVLAAVRRHRAVMFVCHLRPKTQQTNIEKEKESEYSQYIEGSYLKSDPPPIHITGKQAVKPGVTEARHGLVSLFDTLFSHGLYKLSHRYLFLQLEFSQYCNLQFDSVRRAKYSTAMLLYYLLNPESSGVLPACSSCKGDIANVRWHKINKSFDERRRSSQSIAIRTTCVDMTRRELCEQCYETTYTKEDYVPIRVSFKRASQEQP